MLPVTIYRASYVPRMKTARAPAIAARCARVLINRVRLADCSTIPLGLFDEQGLPLASGRLDQLRLATEAEILRARTSRRPRRQQIPDHPFRNPRAVFCDGLDAGIDQGGDIRSNGFDALFKCRRVASYFHAMGCFHPCYSSAGALSVSGERRQLRSAPAAKPFLGAIHGAQ